MTLSRMTISRMRPSIRALSNMKLSRMTLRRMTLSRMESSESHSTELHQAKWHYTQWHTLCSMTTRKMTLVLSFSMLCMLLLSVIRVIVVLQNAVALLLSEKKISPNLICLQTSKIKWRRDTQHIDIQDNDARCNNKNTKLSTTTLDA